ncbi:MAG: penicillin-binding protein 2 [Patescibacteria group bacterium]|nr:penicillin-binding protein 2 [Patescibacteria group bacterium]
MAFRFFALTLIFGLSYGLLGLKLYDLQVKDGNYYFERAQARNEFQAELELRRGQIFFTDRNGSAARVALNRDYPVIFASPKEIGNSYLAAKVLAPIVGWEEEDLQEVLDNPESSFRLLVDRASPEQISAIRDIALEGVYFNKKQYRFYSYGKLASHLTGFVGVNTENDEPAGLYGIEKLRNGDLAEGDDVHLTIDITLQSQAEQTLRELVSRFKASGGTVIIQEPATGKVLALANAPDFDPNAYSEFPIGSFLNPAVQYIYEPGSVFKPLTMAAGIDSGAITPETTYVDKGSVTLNGKTIRNWDKKAYGEITMSKVIEKSVNTGAVFAEQETGHQIFYEYLKKFGFGERTDVDLPDEAGGSLRNLERKDARAIDFATASFGQGTAVTPVQLINAFSAIANGGLLMRPYTDGEAEPYVVRRVVSKETARQVTTMMERAVEKAVVAAIPQYRVAGKTGTAQIPDFEKGGYTEELIHTFVGFAPASNSRFVILLKLDKPESSLAGLTVVPAFRELAEYVLNYYNIPPDKLSQ